MADQRIPVSAAVYDALRADILGGRLQVGDPVPSERTLSERFGVNRHAVREAVKRLQQAGLVQVSHGGATRVLDWSRTGGLELLVDLPAAGDPSAIRAGYELRACLAEDIAARAADRATEEQRAALTERARAFAAAIDDSGRRDNYRDLWEVIVDAADNIAYRLAYNSLLTAEATLPELSLDILRDELHDTASAADLVAAIHDGDPDAARMTARTLTAHTLDAVAVTGAEEVPA